MTCRRDRLHFVSVFVRLRRDESVWQASDELRRASNEESLRAFRDADRFTIFKIFRRPGALRRRVTQRCSTCGAKISETGRMR